MRSVCRRPFYWLLPALIVYALGPLGRAAQSPEPRWRQGELIVHFRPGMAPGEAAGAPAKTSAGSPPAASPAAKLINPSRPESLNKLDRQYGLREGRPLFTRRAAVGAGKARRKNATGNSGAATGDVWLLRLNPAVNMDEALKEYRANPAVLNAEPNFLGSLAYVPTDPLYNQERTDLNAIGLEQAWGIQRGANASVRVAVIDSGIDSTHPDLSAALDLAGSYNFVEKNTSVFDDIGHGTRVAGIIGATANNGEGIAGVAFGCKLMSLDVVDPAGVITVADVASAIEWAWINDADIINVSLCFHAYSITLDGAIRDALGGGVVVVAAAGNENQGDFPVYPAALGGVRAALLEHRQILPQARKEREENLKAALLFSCSPQDGVVKERGERAVLKQFRVMAHEDVHVARPFVLVDPDHRVIAHLRSAGRRVTALIDACQHVHIGSWRAVVGVPFLVLDREALGNSLHDGMIRGLHADRAAGERRNVRLEADAAHKIGEPRPHRIAVELAQQRSVMEADPASPALINVVLKGRRSGRRPGVWRIVQLNEQLVMGEERAVDLRGVFDVIDAESIHFRFVRQPRLGRIHKRLVNAAALGDGHHLERLPLRLRQTASGAQRRRQYGDARLQRAHGTKDSGASV